MHEALHLLVSERVKMLEPDAIPPCVHLGGSPVGLGSCEHVCSDMRSTMFFLSFFLAVALRSWMEKLLQEG